MFDLGFGRVVPPNVPLIVGGGWREGAHAGLDIPLPQGTPLLAAASGTVLRAIPTDSSAAGIHVDLQHPSGALSRYLHMSSIAVAKGQQVAKGQLLGLSGNTGLSSGPHLHFEIRVPAHVIPLIQAVAGVPVGGFNNGLPSIGIGVPSEPWLPVDQYRAAVITGARTAGVPLYSEVPHSQLGTLLIVGGAGALALVYLWKRRRQRG